MITTEAISPGDAMRVEREAIIDERPRYNYQHSTGFGPTVFDYVIQLRADGLTYRQIAHRLEAESGRRTSPDGLRHWFVAEAKRRSVESGEVAA